MDSYREHPGDFEPQASPRPAPRRIRRRRCRRDRHRRTPHARARLQLLGLAARRPRFPVDRRSRPGEVEDFSAAQRASRLHLRRATTRRCLISAPPSATNAGSTTTCATIADVPSRSLLSRLTDHYMQIIANRAPVGFEAEFENQRGENICYRGILMPFSSDGEAIDFIYGVINWKTRRRRRRRATARRRTSPDSTWSSRQLKLTPDRSQLDEVESAQDAAEAVHGRARRRGLRAGRAHFSWEDGPLADRRWRRRRCPEIALDADAGLADRLWAARETAESVKAGEGRTRAALYRALSLAYDFAHRGAATSRRNMPSCSRNRASRRRPARR